MDQEHNPQQPLRQSVMEKIKQGQVKMHSRMFFFWQSLAIFAAMALFAVAAVLASSFLIFSLRATGRIFLPGFGLSGWSVFLKTFPWIILLVILALILVLEILVEKFAYKRPVVYTLGGVLFVIILTGVFVSQTRLHLSLFDQARRNRLPLAGGLYRYYENEHLDALHRGVIEKLNANGFVFLEQDGDVLKVTLPPNFPMSDLHDGDMVLVVGQETNDSIQAIGIRKPDSDPLFNRFFYQRNMK